MLHIYKDETKEATFKVKEVDENGEILQIFPEVFTSDMAAQAFKNKKENEEKK